MCLLAPALGTAEEVGSTPTEALPVVHTLEWARLGVWAGYTLNGHRIEAAYVSDGFTEPGQPGFGELLEMEVAGPSRRWAVRCAFGYGAVTDFTMACDFVPDDGTAPATLVLDTSTGGHLLGGSPLDVTARFDNLDALELRFSHPDGPPVAHWAWRGLRVGHPLALSTSAPSEPAHELATLTVLASLLMGTPPKAGDRYDSYPLVVRGPREALAQRAALTSLEARGAAHEAGILQRFLDETRAIDREGGALVERFPWSPRIAMGIQGGVFFAPGPGGSPGDLSGGSAEVIGGLRLKNLLLTVAMGLHFGALDAARFAEMLGVAAVTSASFSFGLQARYAQPLLGSLEGVVGLSLAARLRLVDVSDWADTDGARQLGLAAGPIIGLQYPLWRMNDLGSRLVMALDGIPEWSLWGDARITSPEGTKDQAERLKQGLGGVDLGVRVQLGFRLEL